MISDNDVRVCIDKSYDTGLKHAAEVAAEYIWHFVLDLGGSEEDAETTARHLYKVITEKDINIREFLGL